MHDIQKKGYAVEKYNNEKEKIGSNRLSEYPVQKYKKDNGAKNKENIKY